MRILGFQKHWDKLGQPRFTTFRFSRRDKDWEIGETVQIVIKPRSKNREYLSVAEIINKEPRCMARCGSKLVEPKVTNAEANDDGFPDGFDSFGNTKSGYFFMWEWLFDTYGGRRLLDEPMNKLTLKWSGLNHGDTESESNSRGAEKPA